MRFGHSLRSAISCQRQVVNRTSKRPRNYFGQKNVCFFFLDEKEREREESRTLNTKSFRLKPIIRSPIVNRTFIAELGEKSYSFGPTFAAIGAESDGRPKRMERGRFDGSINQRPTVPSTFVRAPPRRWRRVVFRWVSLRVQHPRLLRFRLHLSKNCDSSFGPSLVHVRESNDSH